MSVLEGNRLVEAVRGLRAHGRGGVAPYITAGDGGFERTLDALHGLEAGGATCVELGVPFSDPVADGPRLQAAAQRALAAGATLDGVLSVVRRYRAEGGALPIALFSYMNPLLAGGLERRLAALQAAGVDGLLVPDLPLEEAAPVRSAAREAGLALSLFVAPTSGDARVEVAAAATDGFLYVVGRVGVTGASTSLAGETGAYLAHVRSLVGDVPLGVGFGLRERAQVAAALRHAELAIVGTALVEHLHGVVSRAAAEGRCADVRSAARNFLASLRSPCADAPDLGIPS